ncbi:hypothetical protein CHS0354_002596 [Potamilus streckersoni]|uniref:Uncharacterized protein n=1 Tax=Potamilus streckersoni TaxID=2493646 RepID=A0AAE0VH96_9BIVA|nr:hypothetical protein CHS0354_002596 [Potamilus streckersoni]
MSETKRKRIYSRQSHESEPLCMSQETTTTRLSSENDSEMSEGKSSNGRNISFSLDNEVEEIVQDSSNGSASRCHKNDIAIENNISSRGKPNIRPYNFPNNNIYESLDNASENNCQERRQNISPMVNNSRNYRQNSFSEGNCLHPLPRRPSTYSGGIINEHSNDSDHRSGYADVHGNFRDAFHQCLCTFDHNQCKRMCSSVKVLKRVVFALCVFNIILLGMLIIVPVGAVIYFQATKDSRLDTIQPRNSNEQHRTEPTCVKCQSLMQKISTFINTQKVIESMGDENGRCCFSDTEKNMTILNQISEEAVE